MNVEAIMTSHVVSISMDATLRQVQEVFGAHGFHHVVVTERQRVVGIVSDRDLLANISPFVGKLQERPLDAASLDRKVHQIMTRKLIAVKRDSSVTDAARLILEHHISCLPVIDDHGSCVGIVSWRDVLRWTFKDAIGQAGVASSHQLAA